MIVDLRKILKSWLTLEEMKHADINKKFDVLKIICENISEQPKEFDKLNYKDFSDC